MMNLIYTYIHVKPHGKLISCVLVYNIIRKPLPQIIIILPTYLK